MANGQPIAGNTRTFIAGATIAAYSRVNLSSGERRRTPEESLWKPPEQTATTSKFCRSGTKPPSRNQSAT